MSRSAEVTLDWGGEAGRSFRLGIGQVGKLQATLNGGPIGIAARCEIAIAALAFMKRRDLIALSQLDLSKVATLKDVSEVHLQGLLGAGTPAPEALKLVRDWVEERPLAENLASAHAICLAAVYGPEDEPLGESVGEVPTPSPTENGGSQNSTEPAPS